MYMLKVMEPTHFHFFSLTHPQQLASPGLREKIRLGNPVSEINLSAQYTLRR